MERIILSTVNMLSRYGMDVTNPATRGRRNTMRVVILFMFLIPVLLLIYVFHSTEKTYYLRRHRQRNVPTQFNQLCEAMPPGLGPVTINKTHLDLEDLEAYSFPDVKWGGQFSPSSCTARHRVAIIVPYRDRELQLPIFLNHMHQFLMKQKIEYGIFIVEQASRHDYFNRGKLLNVGFVESQKQETDWRCFVFHDIDLLPLDLRNLYSCPDPKHPRHLAAAIEHLKFKLPHKTMFSGAVAMTQEQFSRVNGFSNTYWGFGGEDDNMVFRLHSAGYTISRYDMSIARYASVNHTLNPQNKNQRYKWHSALVEVKNALPKDGLSTLNYSLASVVPHRLYTHIKAHIGKSPTYHQLLKLLKKFRLWQESSGNMTDLEQIKKEFISFL